MSEIVINIPKEFENHFNSDKFEDSLQRLRFDIYKAIIAKKDVLSGNYEIETLDMLTEAFLKGTPLPKCHGRLINADKLYEYIDNEKYTLDKYAEVEDVLDIIAKQPTIIEADKESEVEK